MKSAGDHGAETTALERDATRGVGPLDLRGLRCAGAETRLPEKNLRVGLPAIHGGGTGLLARLREVAPMAAKGKFHPGDAANAFVCVILSDAGEKPGGLTPTEWNDTFTWFGGRCAYTGDALVDGPDGSRPCDSDEP